jgi:hypothetical protein
VFLTAPVNHPSDPLFRGYCGGLNCGTTHEFHDVVIAPDGTPWASFSDACTEDPDAMCDGNVGILGRLVGGPPLIGTIADQTPAVSMPRRCARGGRITIRLRDPRRGRLRSARVTVNGKRVKVRRRGKRLTAVVDLRRKRPTRVVVRVTARTTTGRVVREVRRYRSCG